MNVAYVQKVWDDFIYLFDTLKTCPGEPGYLDSAAYHERAREWANDYRKATFDEDVTPYIHGMLLYVP